MTSYMLKAPCSHCGQWGVDDVTLKCSSCGKTHEITDDQERQRRGDMALHATFSKRWWQR